MRQIFSWTVGSFFRTIGRTVALLGMGALLYYIASRLGFGISDLFFDKVNAEELTVNVESPVPLWFSVDNWSSNWSLFDSDTQLHKVIQSRTSLNQPIMDYIQFQSGWTQNVDYVEFEYRFSQPVDVTGSVYNQEDDISCRQWTCESYSNNGVCSQFKCLSWYTNTGQAQERLVHDSELDGLNFYFTVYNSNGNTRACTINEGRILCPTYGYEILTLNIYTYFQTSLQQQFDFYIMRNARGYKKQATNQDIIDNQNQNAQSIIEQNQNSTNQMLDTNSTATDQKADSFFNSFDTNETYGGLSSIVTAPLVVVNQMLSNTCVAPSATWKGATITLPCGDMFWSRPGAVDLQNLLNVFYGGFICYYAIRKLFLMIENFKDPTHDKIEVTDL